jgi:phosphatidate cytidylyltransferase
MLSLRLLSAAVLIPLLIGAAWLGGPFTIIAVAPWAVAATWELLGIARGGGYEPFRLTGAVLAALFVVAAAFRSWLPADGLYLLVLAAAAVLLTARLARPTATTAFVDWSVTLAAALYIGGMLSCYVLLRELPMGREWVIYCLLMTFGSDSVAYFAGRALGRTPLWPSISPKKTREGAIASLVISASWGTLAQPILGLPLAWWEGAILGAIVSLAAQTGDLAESALKRAGHVKDAGEAIPGHGGVLDRTDSLTFVGLSVYFAALWLNRG